MRRVPGFEAILAAAVFVALALATTGIVHGSGKEIVDTGRYQDYAEGMQSSLVPYRDFDFEYPPGALALFLAPALVADHEQRFFWSFAVLMALWGASAVLITAASLRRLGRTRSQTRAVLALVAVSPVVLGGVLLTRFDLVPAALVAGATLALLHGRSRVAAIVLGTGAAVKLYPLLLVPLLAVWAWRRRGRREAIVSIGVSIGIVALAYAPFLALSPDGVAHSVWRQLVRPLQIESLGAGVLVLLHSVAGFEIVVETSSGSQNLTGNVAVAAATALSLAGLAAIVGVWVGFVRGVPEDDRVVRYGAAVFVAFVAFGKVLSPQFLIWLVFPLALVAGRRGVAAGTCFAVAAVATAIWFPWRYFDLPRNLDPLVAGLVVLRGIALVAALAILVTAPRSSPRSPEAADGRL